MKPGLMSVSWVVVWVKQGNTIYMACDCCSVSLQLIPVCMIRRPYIGVDSASKGSDTLH